MNRNIVLINDGQIQNTDPLCEYINIKNVNNIVNYSVDNLFCDCLEYINDDQLAILIQSLAQKIRPNGYLNLKILDTKKICLEYLQNKIDNKYFIKQFRDKNSLLSLDNISMNIDNQVFITTKIDSADYHIVITLQKKQIQ